jgi:cardiolipin synthase
MSVLTAANQLTLMRLLLVPVFVLCMLYALPGWALLTFGVAAATDAFDGHLARRLGQPTNLGAWLDPMADKILIATMFVMLTLPGLGLPNRLPVWLTVLVLSRDVAIVLTVAVFNLAVARRTFRPTMLGKMTTVVFVATGVITLVANYLGSPSVLVPVGVYASLVFTLASAVEYVLRMTRGAEETREPA